MTGKTYNVLFLCTGNSARSIMAEALLEHWGKGPFRGHSAGSKSWDEFAKPGAPVMDFVFTVCDQAASEACPVWPGNPVTAHWGVPDPAAAEGPEAEKLRAFRYAYQALETRIKLFTSLRLEALDRLAIKREVDEIGHLRIVASGEPAP